DIIDFYYQRHMKAIEIIGNAAGVVGKVVHFDVSGHDMEGYSKFIPYYLYPDTLYSVGVSLSPQRAKISVGFNPWGDGTRNHNLASICERYGGGGHPVVGAISFSPLELDRAREVASSIVEELKNN